MSGSARESGSLRREFTSRWIASRAACFFMLAAGWIHSSSATADDTPGHARLCIAEGGASAYAPYNTMASFRLALTMKPDYLETDLQLSKDGVLICIHDASLENVTDVSSVFPDRFSRIDRGGRTEKTWYVNDFTLAELKTLDAGSRFNAKFKGEPLAAFQELVDLAKGKVGLYPELKDADFYAARKIDLAQALHETFTRNNLGTRAGQKDTPLVVQSFHASALKRMRELGGKNYTLIQLVWFNQWTDFMSNDGLDRVAAYADGIGPPLSLVLPPESSRIFEAHKRGLSVHVWKAHEAFPPARFKTAVDFEKYLLDVLGIDAIFTDRPDQFPRL